MLLLGLVIFYDFFELFFEFLLLILVGGILRLDVATVYGALARLQILQLFAVVIAAVQDVRVKRCVDSSLLGLRSARFLGAALDIASALDDKFLRALIHNLLVLLLRLVVFQVNCPDILQVICQKRWLRMRASFGSGLSAIIEQFEISRDTCIVREELIDIEQLGGKT